MRRRDFITLVGGAAAWPLAARAQQPAMPVIGFLGASTRSSWAAWTAAFVQGLHELGWIEGHTVKIEYRWAEGQTEKYAEIATEFARLKVNVILTVGTAVLAAQQAAPNIPIVFAASIEPVASGMVASLAHPGGNATGFSVQSVDLAGKRVEILRELLPDLRQLTVIADAGYSGSVLETEEVQSSARKLGIAVDVPAIRRAQDIGHAFEVLKSETQALYVCAGALINANHGRINTLALGARLPTMHAMRDFVGAGGLLSYGPNQTDLFRRSAKYVDNILKGAKPADLPVEQPTKFELVIDMTTAKALRLKVSESFLLRADEVIE